MKTNREKLEKQIHLLFDEYDTNKKIKKKIGEILEKNGFLPGDVNAWFSKQKPIQIESLTVLCLLTVALFEATEDYSVDPSKFFTQQEVEKAKLYTVEQSDKTQYPIVIKNLRQINLDHWIGYMEIQEVAALYRKRVVTYNPETQREMTVRTYKDKIIEEISINTKSVASIKKAILEGEFITNFITFNILQNGEENFYFNDKTGVLTIESGEFNTTDGFHRDLGMVYAVQENPNVKYITGVHITNFGVEKAKKYIAQEDKKNKMSEKYVKTLDQDNLSNRIVNKINEDSKSYLKGKITSNQLRLKQDHTLIDYVLLSDAISHIFNPKETKDIINMSKEIVNGMNHITETYPEILEKSVKKDFWIGALALINELGGSSSLLSGIIAKAENNNLEVKNTSKTTINNVSTYYKNFINN
jgi:hypothetical protein